MIINQIDQVTISLIIKVLSSSGLVIMPTETVYGAFVDATNKKAVEKLNQYKARPFGKPYSVAVLNKEMAEKYVELNDSAKKLYQNFLPGPLTIISKGKHKVAPGIESEDGKLGIRIPDYQLILDVIKSFGKPITATSANASYQKRPYSISDILDNLSEKQKKLIDLIVDLGTLPKNEPSTVIDTTLDDLVTLRQGDIKFGNENKITSRSPENTMNLAKELFQKYETYLNKRPLVFALEGEMGVGKTVFTKGLAKAMGIKDEVTSPTYDLMNSFKPSALSFELIHIDAWRLFEPSEINSLDFPNLINKPNTVFSIEWADRVSEEIQKYSDQAIIVWVKISYLTENDERKITWQTK